MHIDLYTYVHTYIYIYIWNMFTHIYVYIYIYIHLFLYLYLRYFYITQSLASKNRTYNWMWWDIHNQLHKCHGQVTWSVTHGRPSHFVG